MLASRHVRIVLSSIRVGLRKAAPIIPSAKARGYRSFLHSTRIHNVSYVRDKKQALPMVVLQARMLGGAVGNRRQYSTEIPDRMLRLVTPDREFTFNSTWLRENCTCNNCFNHATNQRNILYYALKPVEITAQSQQLQEGSVHVTWSDGHVSSYPVDWLQKHTLGGEPEYIEKVLWDKTSMRDHNPHPVLYEEFMSSESGLKQLLESLLRYGVGFVSGVSPDVPGTEKTCLRICHVMETLFGRMYEFTADNARGDTAYTNIALGAHTDNTYLQLPAGIQVFHVTFHDGEGGQTLLVDGFRAAEKLRQNNGKAFDLLKTIRINHHYREPGHHVSSLAPVLVTHPITDELIHIRYNHYDRSTLTTVPHDKLGEYYDALAELSSYVTDPEGEHWVPLRPGNVIFVDNFRVMHGRSAFTGTRRVCGCYLPRDDWVGRARTLGLTP